jgi:amino acid transporter
MTGPDEVAKGDESMSSPTSDSDSIPARAELGEHHLGTIHAVGQALAIGPIMSAGIFTGFIAAVAGFSSPASVLLASIGCLALGYVVVLYARRYAGAGGIYEYLARAGNRGLGIYSAGIYFLTTMVIAGGFSIGLGFLLNGFWLNHISSSGAPVWWVFSLIYLLFIGVMNYFGVRIAIWGVLGFAIISAIPMVILAIVIIAKGGANGQALETLNPAHGSINAIFNGVLFGVTLFIGFEAAASIAEETRNPRRSIPRAVLWSIGISAVFFLLITYAATIGYGAQGIDEWVGSSSPLGTLATRFVGSPLAVIIDLVVIIDLISAGLAFAIAGTRGIFALSRDRFLPSALSSTTRYGTPLGGLVVIIASALALTLWASVTHYGRTVNLPDEFQAWQIIVAGGSFVIELVYIFLAIVAFRIIYKLKAGPRGWWRYLVALVGLAVPILAFKGSLVPWPKYPNFGVYLAIGILVVAAVWYVILRVTRPEAISKAADYASEERTVV